MSKTNPKRSSRPPPRLRTKTGCITCRNRRKKCDEHRPVCSTCLRLNILCVYRNVSEDSSISPSTSSASPIRLPSEYETGDEAPTPALLGTSIWRRPSGIRTQRDLNIFQYCQERFIQLLTTPDAVAEFRDVSFLFAIGFDQPFVMHAALAPAALHAACAELIPVEEAIVYTQSALQGLRQATQALDSTSDARHAFLAASLFMGVFEDFYSSTSSASMTHYRAIGKVLEDTVAGVPRLLLSRLSVFERILLDSVLYHFATRLLLEQDITPICASFPTDAMAKYIEALESESQDSHASASILPVIGKIPPAVFLLIYQVTWLSRQLPFQDDQKRTLASQCFAELDCLKSTHPVLNFQESGGGFPALRNSEVAAKLYTLALRIFLAKVLDPDSISSGASLMQGFSATGLALLRLYDATAPCGQFICWPIFILGCAACPSTTSELLNHAEQDSEMQLRTEIRQLIQTLLLQIWKVSYSGYVRRIASALEQIWKLPLVLRQTEAHDDASNVEDSYDGLLALISKNGAGAGLCA